MQFRKRARVLYIYCQPVGSSYTHAGVCTVADRPIVRTPACICHNTTAFVHNTHVGMGLASNCPQHKVKKYYMATNLDF